MITLITTTRGRPELLRRCAESIKAQTYPCDKWVIYVDDHLNEYSEVINYIESSLPQAVIVGGVKVGRVRALNLAHEHFTYGYAALLDDDDWLDSECLYECSQHSTDIVYTDFYCVCDKVTHIGHRNTIPYTWDMMLNLNIMFHFRMYKLSLYRAVGGFDETFTTTMDYDITLRMLTHNPTITKINKPLYYYRVHSNSISGLHRNLQYNNKIRAIRKHVR